MIESTEKRAHISALRKQIMEMEGFKLMAKQDEVDVGLDFMREAFPNGVFPTGVIHEFISMDGPSRSAATNAFMLGIIQGLLRSDGVCFWVSNVRTLFPSALLSFGVHPQQVVFVDVSRDHDVLWVVEQALKSKAVRVVVGELSEVHFVESQRLQLAVESSRATGFLHRYTPRRTNTLATTTRWKITPTPSVQEDGLPGVGFPSWKVELLKVRNGKPGSWQVAWIDGQFHFLPIGSASESIRWKQHYA